MMRTFIRANTVTSSTSLWPLDSGIMVESHLIMAIIHRQVRPEKPLARSNTKGRDAFAPLSRAVRTEDLLAMRIQEPLWPMADSTIKHQPHSSSRSTHTIKSSLLIVSRQLRRRMRLWIGVRLYCRLRRRKTLATSSWIRETLDNMICIPKSSMTTRTVWLWKWTNHMDW